MTHHFNHDPSEVCSTCGCEEFVFSSNGPFGYFCIECGTPDVETLEILEFEEPGVWA